MEFDLSLPVAVVRIGILYFDQGRNVLYYLHYFTQPLGIDHIHHLFVKQLNEQGIGLVPHFGIFGVNSKDLNTHLFDELLCLSVLDRNLDNSILGLYDMNNSLMNSGVDIAMLVSQCCE